MSEISAINSPSPQMPKPDSSGDSAVTRIARSKGAPESVISQGPSAIRTWAKENGVVSSPNQGQPNIPGSRLNVKA